MPDSFNKNLAAFLTACKESAIQELAQNNARYRQLQSNAAEISKKVKNEIPREYEKLIEDLTDSMYALTRMELNYLYFRGFRDCVNLFKRLDGSFSESGEFERFFT